MKELRIRIELNKGRVGMPFGKLARICQDASKFLVMLSEDLHFPDSGAEWLAERFENASVDFDLRYGRPLDAMQAEIGRQALVALLNDDHDPEVTMRLRADTVRQFRQIPRSLDVSESMRWGLYSEASASPDGWYELRREHAEAAESELVDRHAYGEIQGTVNAFFTEHDPPYLRIRELSTGDLVKCYFDPPMYRAAVDLLEERDAVIFVEGWLKEDASSGATKEIKVKDFRPAPEFSLADLEAALGTVPDYTDGMETSRFLEKFRGE